MNIIKTYLLYIIPCFIMYIIITTAFLKLSNDLKVNVIKIKKDPIELYELNNLEHHEKIKNNI